MKHLSYGKIITRIALSAQDQNIHRHLKMIYIKYTISRAWYNGSTSASQAEDEGSIPFARTKNTADPCGRIYFWHVATEEIPKKDSAIALSFFTYIIYV